MADLKFIYGAMNSGKTIDILRTSHNYEEKGFKTIIVKPTIDKKGDWDIVSRIGIKRKVDFLISSKELVSNSIKEINPKVIFADEAQFFSKEQIDDLWMIAKEKDIIVLCYGLKNDFKSLLFPGSKRLIELADHIEELTTLCECGEKATFNLKKLNNEPIFFGEQVAIDGFDEVTYDAVCGSCYLKKYNEAYKKGLTKTRKIFKEEEK